MTASQLVLEIRRFGGDVALLRDEDRLALLRRSRIPDELASLAKKRVGDLRALFGEFALTSAGDAIAEAERIVRRGKRSHQN